MAEEILTKYISDSEFCTPASLRDLQLEMLKLLKIVDKVCRANNIQYWIDCGTLLGSVRHKGFIPWDDDIDVCVPNNDYHKLLELLDIESKSNKHTFLLHYKSKYLHWVDDFATTNMLMKDDNTFVPCKIDIFPMKFIHPYQKQHDIETTKIGLYYSYCIYDETLERKYIKKTFAEWFEQKQLFLDYYNNIYMPSCNYKAKDGLVIYSFGDTINYKQQYYNYDDIFPLQQIEFEGCQFFAPNNTDAVLSGNYGDYMRLPPAELRVPYHSNTQYFCQNKEFAMQVATEYVAYYRNEFKFKYKAYKSFFVYKIMMRLLRNKSIMKLRGKLQIGTRFKRLIRTIFHIFNTT